MPPSNEPVDPRTHALLLDSMLGKLPVYLRMCGYDAAYVDARDTPDDDSILERAHEEGRLLVSRDVDLVASHADGVLVTKRDVMDQLRELHIAGFDLTLANQPVRCGRCNGHLERVNDEDDRPDYAPPPAEFDCWRCTSCSQWFWMGSHWDRVGRRLDRLVD